MNFKTYYRQLSRPEREAYAQRASTSTKYLEVHLMPARRMPRRDLMERLAEASGGNVSLEEVIQHFFKSTA